MPKSSNSQPGLAVRKVHFCPQIFQLAVSKVDFCPQIFQLAVRARSQESAFLSPNLSPYLPTRSQESGFLSPNLPTRSQESAFLSPNLSPYLPTRSQESTFLSPNLPTRFQLAVRKVDFCPQIFQLAVRKVHFCPQIFISVPKSSNSQSGKCKTPRLPSTDLSTSMIVGRRTTLPTNMEPDVRGGSWFGLFPLKGTSGST